MPPTTGCVSGCRIWHGRGPGLGIDGEFALLRAEGLAVNHKRVSRLCREEGLRVRGNNRERRRVGVSTPGSRRLVATAANQVWAIDFQFDTTSDGRTSKLCNVTDEFTREALAINVGRAFDAAATIAVLDRIAAKRGAPAFVRCDNGPELTASKE